MTSRKINKKAFLKVSILAGFIVLAVILVRFTPIKELFEAEQFGYFLQKAGILAPIVFMVIYAIGICLFVPGTVLGAMGALFFGTWLGFLYVWLGAMTGAMLSFLIGRYLGREFTASLIGEKLDRYDEAIERNGFATVLYLRLIYFPFTPMNFGMGLTKVRFWDYVAGTGLGIMVGTFIFIFFVGTLKDVWTEGHWGELLSWKVFFSLLLFVFSFFMPILLKKMKGKIKSLGLKRVQ